MRLHFPYKPPLTSVQLVAEYLSALLLVALLTGGLYLIQSQINPAVVALLYLLPVGLSTALWGLGPGVGAGLLAFLAFNYFFLPPYYTLRVHQTQDVLALGVFLLLVVVISQLVGSTQRSLEEATAREREAVRLFELSTVLAGLQDDREIVWTIVQHTLDTFQADQVEIFVEGDKGSSPKIVSLRSDREGLPGPSTLPEKPTLLVPLQSARGLLGEIRLWRQYSPLSPAEERLLRTFGGQAVLALERARLAQTETRARVLEESDKLKTSLLSSVSHELRTPLATIMASVTSLRSDSMELDPEARAELLEAIDEETNHLNQLVGNLLNMSRIEAGALKLQIQWNVLDEIVSGVLHRLRAHHFPDTSQHRFQVELPEDLPLVPVDYVLMEQVFTNLLTNSLKYSPPNSVIRIRAWVQDKNTLQVQVTNQGPPVPEEHLERIFDKFYRTMAAERVTGTGLGLSICKGIVEAHGGRIWGENLPGGFAFNFTLPLTREGERPATGHAEVVET